MIENVLEDDVESLLLLYERNDKSGGDKYIDYKYTSETNTLIITYENEEIAKQVVDFGNVIFRKKPYKAKFLQELKKSQLNAITDNSSKISQNAVMIEDVLEDDVESLLLLYERNDKSGGDKHIDYKYTSETNTLIITYENDEIAKRVVDFGNVIFRKKAYNAKFLQGLKKSQLNAKIDNSSKISQNAVMIENVSKNEIDYVKAYFSKDNEIEKYELNESVLFIHYKTEEIAQSVLNHEPFHRKNKIFKPKAFVYKESNILEGNEGNFNFLLEKIIYSHF
jgi:hypothetical protein